MIEPSPDPYWDHRDRLTRRRRAAAWVALIVGSWLLGAGVAAAILFVTEW